MVFALIGNQNCGKTTLFNQLTGSSQHVGNFPGVTVDKKVGTVKFDKSSSVVDLPGIYSISPYTNEEIVTRDFLINEKPDGIINIIDATNIERNLYLTLQLLEMKIPMVLALNMMDEVKSNGGSVDFKKLSEALKIPVIPICACKNEGVRELATLAVKTASEKQVPAHLDFCTGPVHRAIHSISHVIEDHAAKIGVPVRFASTKLVEGDEPMLKSLGLSENEADIIDHTVHEMEDSLGTDREAALADMRYEYIEKLVTQCVKKPKGPSKEQERTEIIDSVLTNKYLAIPIFLGIMAFIFYLTFGLIGTTLSSLLETAIEKITLVTQNALINANVSQALRSLVIDGIFNGVGSVLSFLPTIIVLFFLLSILEDSGYMARIAFVMDKLLRKIGLSGRSFVPLLIGFGCSVPAIMATRTLSSERDRRMTILLVPFISCSAKVPIYAVFTKLFFPDHAVPVMIFLYILGILMGILVGLIFKNTLFKGKPIPFVMELPAYRFPSLKNVLLHMWEKAADFLRKAFTVIFCATIVIWLLQNFDLGLNMVDAKDSILASIGQFIAPVFAPLGFGDWRAVTALITGLTAKEAVISTLSVLLTGENALAALFTPLQAMSFLVFTLLYMPCIAAMAAIKREIGSTIKAAGIMVWQTGFAWAASFIFYNAVSIFI